MSESQTPEPGWPEWADTPEKRERNRQHWRAHNERVRTAQEARFAVGSKVTLAEDPALGTGTVMAVAGDVLDVDFEDSDGTVTTVDGPSVHFRPVPEGGQS